MQLWNRLYNTVWLAFFSCVLIPRWMGPYAGIPIHLLLGLAMLFLTQGNARRLASLAVPLRLQRISRVTAGFAIFQAACGIAIAAAKHLGAKAAWAVPLLMGMHLVSALAILSQASSVATAFDMWEEKEFEMRDSSKKDQ
jgi:hypothetical protein